MWRRVIRHFAALLLLVPYAHGQTAPHVEIKLPPEVKSETFFARYVLTGDDLGGWIQPQAGISAYAISMLRDGKPAPGIKAILYAPGCAIQTLDLKLSVFGNQSDSFVCQPVKNVHIEGTLTQPERLLGREVELQARYIARWAQKFLNLQSNLITGIPIGSVGHVSEDGRFRLEIPDLSQDPLAASDDAGEVQIWAKDIQTGAMIAQVTPDRNSLVATQMGGLKIRSEYPAGVVFAPCTVNGRRPHDRFGFMSRTSIVDACDR